MDKLHLCANCKNKKLVGATQQATNLIIKQWQVYFCNITDERIWDKHCFCNNDWQDGGIWDESALEEKVIFNN